MADSKKSQFILIIALLILVVSTVRAEIPQMINYQGRLTNSAGDPVADDSYLIKFKIYGSESGNDSLWYSGFRTVQVVDGLFNYQLGSFYPIPDDLFSTDSNRYLGITVGADAEISPRVKIVSSAYSFHALRADTALYALESGGDFVKKTGDTVAGHLYFDAGSSGAEAELLLYGGVSILNLYQEGVKAISMESEFSTVVLRGPDEDYAVQLSGGEDEDYDGGSIKLYNAHGNSQMEFNGGLSGDASVDLPNNAINQDEILNEPGIVSENNYLYITLASNSTMQDLELVTITIPDDGYIVVEGKCYGRTSGTTGTNYGYIQIDETSGGGNALPYMQQFGANEHFSSSQIIYYPIYVTRVYSKTGGTYTFRMEGHRGYNGAGALTQSTNHILTATYYSTSYGTVSAVVSSAEARNFENVTTETIRRIDEHGNEIQETVYSVDLRELEIKAKQRRIEALEAELKLQQAREQIKR